MSKRPQSALEAMNAGLYVLSEHNRCSYAPHVEDRAQRDLLATMCGERVDQALNGDTDVARRILDDFVRSVRQHPKRSWRGPNHYVYAQYLADAFQRILDGADAAIALRIKSSKAGRRKGTTTHDGKALHAAYQLLVRGGRKTEQAIELLSDITGADRTTIQKSRKTRFTMSFEHRGMADDHKLIAVITAQWWSGKLLQALKK
jgi:hypothetical protein